LPICKNLEKARINVKETRRAMKRYLLLLVVLAGCVTTPETGRQALIVTSEAQENQMGEQAYREILAKERRSNNSRWTEIVQRVGQRIAAAANKPGFQWEFVLVESKQQNAFCLPGGKVAIYTGILPIAKNEAGLATVMGHEVAHATARHGGQRMTTALGVEVVQAGLAAALGGKDPQKRKTVLAALGVGGMVGVMLPFSRSNESEADQIGLVYMARAGYDPREGPDFWQRFAASAGSGGLEFLSTHPNSKGRSEAMQAQLPAVLPLYENSPKYGSGENF
jgi:metalloendopeptidase OMA1, mitochondrial